jgi:hypothetical protein
LNVRPYRVFIGIKIKINYFEVISTAMNTDSTYFYHGIPGRYALVDAYTRFIWLVIEETDIALEIRKIFASSKINLVVFDLTSYENYETGLIDNTVCFDWQVPAFTNQLLTEPSIIFSTADAVQQETKNSKLENIKQINRLEKSRMVDLQNQMMLIRHFLMLFENISQPKKNILVKELHDASPSPVIENFYQICKTELSTDDIERELCNMSYSNLSSSKDLRITSTILAQLGKLYG